MNRAAGPFPWDRLADGLVTVAVQTFEAVLDTGFEGGLQLPDAWLPRLRASLPAPHQRLTYQLADGRITHANSYLLEAELDGETIRVETLFAESDEILLGVDALRDYRLVIDFPAGTVALDRTP